MAKKKLQGNLIALNNLKTATVIVETVKIHDRYKKRYRAKKKYLCHIKEGEKYEIGQQVVIEESKPISKLKKWIVLNVVSHKKGN